MTQFDSDAVFRNNYCIQRIETGVAEQFNAAHRMRPEQILIKLSWDLSIDITFNPTLFSLVNTFNEPKLDLLDMLECKKTKKLAKGLQLICG